MSAFDIDDYINKISSKVKLLASKFAGLFQREIVNIFANKFCPIYLYKLH